MKLLDLNPQQVGAHKVLSLVFLSLAAPDKALAEVQKKQEPSWREQGLAICYYAAGQKSEADT